MALNFLRKPSSKVALMDYYTSMTELSMQYRCTTLICNARVGHDQVNKGAVESKSC